MMIRKQLIALANKGLKSVPHHFAPALSTGTFFSGAIGSSSKSDTIRSFSSTTETLKGKTFDDYIDNNWNSMSESEKKNFAFMEHNISERYPKRSSDIYFYRGLSSLDRENHESEALLSFFRAIRNSKDNSIKLKSYNYIIDVYKKLNLPLKVEEIEKKRQGLLVHMDEIEKKKRSMMLITTKTNNSLELYQSDEESPLNAASL
jgi:hypothetical protein